MNWLKDLKDKSFKLFGSIPARKKSTNKPRQNGASRKSYRETGYPAAQKSVQPKGMPKQER